MEGEGGNQGSPNSLAQQFCSITGADEAIAANLLEACGNNLEMAIGMHMDGGGVAAAQSPPAPPQPDGASTSAAAPGSPISDSDEIRAPIPQRTEVLVDGHYRFGMRGRRRAVRSVFDGFRDFQAEARDQECNVGGGGVKTRNKRKTLEELFRPPIDLIFHGSFQAARTNGTNSNRWLLVNIQDVHEFACQALNRDVWSNASVKSTIKSKFIFWQVYADSEDGQRYMQFYNVPDWPYIAILDPRTGEKMMVWHKVDATTLCDLLNAFLEDHPSPDGSVADPCPVPAAKKREDSIVDASEESQMEAAIQASLTELASATSKNTDDSDDFGSEDEVETFSDSDDSGAQTPSKSNGNSPKKTPTKNTKASPQKDTTPNKSKCKKSSPPSPAKCIKSSQEQRDSKSPTAGGSSRKNTASVKRDGDKRDSVSPQKYTERSKHSPSKNVGKKSSETCRSSVKRHSSGGEKSPSKKRRKSQEERVPEAGCSNSSQSEEQKSWKDYLGKDDDPKSNLMIRFPDGNRQQLSLSSSSTLMAVLQYVAEAGYPREKFEMVTTFPKRKLSQMDTTGTLKDLGLYPQETIFVQET